MFQATGNFLKSLVPSLGTPFTTINMNPNDPNGTLIIKLNKVELRNADITKIHVDAIVNAANARLSGGSGVNGAIQKAAGPNLLQDCKKQYPKGCKTGWAEITKSFGMSNCEWIIHAVGPDFRQNVMGSARDMDAELGSCYTRSLTLAVTNGARSVAFPTISTGTFGFPRGRAAEVAMGAVKAFLSTQMGAELGRIVFLMFGDADQVEYSKRFE